MNRLDILMIAIPIIVIILYIIAIAYTNYQIKMFELKTGKKIEQLEQEMEKWKKTK